MARAGEAGLVDGQRTVSEMWRENLAFSEYGRYEDQHERDRCELRYLH
jgi:hypothetical protein